MNVNHFSNLQVEQIEWEDICQMDESWSNLSDIESWYDDRGHCIVDQVGFVVYEDDNYILFSDSYIESMECYGNVTKIPKSVIRKRIKLYEQNPNTD